MMDNEVNLFRRQSKDTIAGWAMDSRGIQIGGDKGDKGTAGMTNWYAVSI
jgi:hypothetical protein